MVTGYNCKMISSPRTSTLGTITASASAVDSTAVVTTCSLNAAALLPMLGITRLTTCGAIHQSQGTLEMALDRDMPASQPRMVSRTWFEGSRRCCLD